MEIFYISLITLIAATIGTITGFGTSTLMIPVLVIFFPPVEAIFQSKFKIPAGNIAALSGGALSGFFAGMFEIGGAIRSMFLTAFDLPKAVYIATSGAIGLKLIMRL